ncbi:MULTISPECIES: hypothetical protein [unclassified Gilliamella]|uniref:hypothetical protein n=1 Tax=Gilliamella TaxID=1193503 RepID=UPI000A32DD35|nr:MULTISPECIES: hypothetical protein [unclassified Gilliamella]OTQ70610.1 hypothetical protein B6C99_12815 [Gilliamella sp. N-G2]OTQ77250.1 hypothetical protein B6D23_12210 [Gilliamella sp. N-W3]
MIRKILNDIKKGPTILTLSQIVDIIKSLQLLKVEEILKNDKDFLEILDLLVESYSDSAIFEVNNNNKFFLEKFSDWLLKLGKKYPIGRNKDDLSSYSDIFLKEM